MRLRARHFIHRISWPSPYLQRKSKQNHQRHQHTHTDAIYHDDAIKMSDQENNDASMMMDEDQSSPSSSSLHTLPTRRFYLTRRGKILQSTTERYLRDDLGYGTMLVPSTVTGGKSTDTIAGKIVNLVPWTIESVSSLWNVVTSTESSYGNKIRLAVVDTNVLLHHMDVLEYLRDTEDDAGSNKDERPRK